MQQIAHPIAASADFQAFAATSSHAADTEGQRIRFAAADLFQQGRLAEADLLTCEALRQYPDSEDVLVIRALICEVQQDWANAASALQRLLALQGPQAPVQTWCHRVRVLRCDGQLTTALQTVLQALQQHPGHPALANELAQLEALGVRAERQAA